VGVCLNIAVPCCSFIVSSLWLLHAATHAMFDAATNTTNPLKTHCVSHTQAKMLQVHSRPWKALLYGSSSAPTHQQLQLAAWSSLNSLQQHKTFDNTLWEMHRSCSCCRPRCLEPHLEMMQEVTFTHMHDWLHTAPVYEGQTSAGRQSREPVPIQNHAQLHTRRCIGGLCKHHTQEVACCRGCWLQLYCRQVGSMSSSGHAFQPQHTFQPIIHADSPVACGGALCMTLPATDAAVEVLSAAAAAAAAASSGVLMCSSCSAAVICCTLRGLGRHMSMPQLSACCWTDVPPACPAGADRSDAVQAMMGKAMPCSARRHCAVAQPSSTGI